MVISKEVLSDFKEKFEQVKKTGREESKLDDSSHFGTTPYDDAYALLDDMLVDLPDTFKVPNKDSEDYLIYTVVNAYICKEMGRLDVLLRRSSRAESRLSECLETLKEHLVDPAAVIHAVAANIELGLNASNENKHVTAKRCFEAAEIIYKDFKATGQTPLTIFELLSAADDIEKREGRMELGKAYTMVTYYLAQVLGQLGESEGSASYFHITLKRQLEAEDYVPIDWALNTATLSQYYLTPNRYTEARHHLAAATQIILEYEQKMLTPEMTFEEQEAVQETFNHRFADIARCWTKYALALLIASRDRLLSDEETPPSPTKSEKCEFTTLKLPPYEITDRYVLTFEDGKPVYHFAMKWIEKSKVYYNSETEATEWARIISDEADIYKLIAFFEDDPQTQCKYYKKRADLLEQILSTLNPTFYLTICRQAWYDAAMAYSTMMDTKLDMQKATEDPTPHQRKKVNILAEKAITHHQSLIKSYKEKESIPEDEMHLYLCAHFYIGRLFYKILTPDRKQQLKNLRNSLRYYDQFVLKCEENKAAGDGLKAEVGVCKEMLMLLPVKIETLVKELEGL